MLKNSKIKIVSIVPRLQARLVSVMPSYSIPKLVNVKANSIGHGIKPTFTRTSTAYKSDGTVVSAGVPRFERVGKNLFNISKYYIQYQADVSEYISVLTSNDITITQSSNVWVYIPTIKGSTYTIKLNGKVFDLSKYRILELYYTDNPTSTIYDGWTYYGGMFDALTDTIQQRSAVFIAQGSYLVFFMPSASNGFELANIQLELGSTATAYEPYQTGVLVEEGTTNLLTSAQHAFYSAGGYTISGQQDMAGGNTAYLLTDSNNAGNSQIQFAYISVLANATSYTLSIYLKQDTASQTLINFNLTGGTAQYNDIIITWATKTTSRGTLVNIIGDWYKLTFTITNNGTNTLLTSSIFPANYVTGGSSVGNVYAWKPQLEAKPYATSFHPTTRTAESLTIPASALSASAFTLEIDQYFTVLSLTDISVFTQFIDWSNYFMAGIRADSKRFRVKFVINGVVYTQESAILSIPLDAKSRLALSYDGTTYRGYFAGIKVLEWTSTTNIFNEPLNLNKLSSYCSPNKYFSNLRIGNKARTDAELANTGALAVDEYTTYFAKLTSDLTAHQKGNGNAVLKSIAC